MPPACVKYLHILDIKHEPDDMVFRFWGTGLTDIFRHERTGRSLLRETFERSHENRQQEVRDDIRAVVEDGEPQGFLVDAAYVRQFDKSLCASGLRLPLSNDGDQVNHVVTQFDFSTSPRAWQQFFEERMAEASVASL